MDIIIPIKITLARTIPVRTVIILLPAMHLEIVHRTNLRISHRTAQETVINKQNMQRDFQNISE